MTPSAILRSLIFFRVILEFFCALNSRISAFIGGDRAMNGFIRWEGGEYLHMYGLHHLSSFEFGQKVYTTGLGGTYPEGLFIGTTVGRQDSAVTVYTSTNVKPAVDFSRVYEVFILKDSEQSDIWDDGDGSGYFQRPEIQ